jgi:Pectate lyase superfamily protein
MTVNISYFAGAGWQFFDNDGVPLSGGLLYSYTAGTTTPATTYTTSTGSIANSNPVVLDSAGRVNEIWLTAGVNYKFVLKTSGGVTLGTYDNIAGVNDTTGFASLLTAFEADLANNSDPAKGDALVGFRQSNVSGNLTNAVGKTVHQKLQEIVSVKDFGAVGNGTTDDTTAIQNCANYCVANAGILYLPVGVYKITSAIDCGASIRGDGPNVSIIKNYGTGDGLDISQANYYSTFENFSVDGSGNASSKNGISMFRAGATTGNNVAYSHFFNVYSYNNGGDGFYHRQAWATRYLQCKAHYNGGLGYNLYYYSTGPTPDAGGANGVNFIECDARWNGGSSAGTTYNDFKGGIRIEGCAEVLWLGGIIESNNAWGVIIKSAYDATRSVFINNIYAENNGHAATVGGFMYVGTSTVSDVGMNQCWIGYGQNTGQTNYFVYNSGTAKISLNDNFQVSFGTGTNIEYQGVANTPWFTLISPVLGDVGASGVPFTYTLLTASNDGNYVFSGVVTCMRTGVTNQHGYFPFVASRDNAGSRSVEFGANAGTALGANPTIAWSGNDLQVTFPAYEYGNIQINPAVNATTTLTFNTTVFPQMSRVMRPS